MERERQFRKSGAVDQGRESSRKVLEKNSRRWQEEETRLFDESRRS